ncbi:Fc.00g057440.m01.CDS01 [Cosmosporella sp. VM-42]
MSSSGGWGCSNPECRGKSLNPSSSMACLHCGCRPATNFQNIQIATNYASGNPKTDANGNPRPDVPLPAPDKKK